MRGGSVPFEGIQFNEVTSGAIRIFVQLSSSQPDDAASCATFGEADNILGPMRSLRVLHQRGDRNSSAGLENRGVERRLERRSREETRPLTDHKMSKPYIPVLLGKGVVMDMIRNRMKNVVGSGGAISHEIVVANAPPASPVPARKKGKRSAQVDLTQFHQVDDSINLTFQNVSAHSQLGSVREVAEHLLLSHDRELLKEMGDGGIASSLFDQSFLNMQKAAFLKERTLAMVTELKELSAERVNWRKEMAAVKRARDEAGQIVKKLESAKLEDVRRLERAAADCKILQDRVVALEQQILYESCETEVRVRGEMALAFLENQPPKTWDVQQYIEEFNEWKADKEQETQLACNFAGMTTGDDHP